jgi:hypothetical protein
MTSMNRAFTRLSMGRLYKSWFVRFGSDDDSGAWCRQIFRFSGKASGRAKVVPIMTELRSKH